MNKKNQALAVDFESTLGELRYADVVVEQKGKMIDFFVKGEFSQQDQKRIKERARFLISGKEKEHYHRAWVVTFALALEKFEKDMFAFFNVKHPPIDPDFEKRKEAYIELIDNMINNLGKNIYLNDEDILIDDETKFAYLIAFVDVFHDQNASDDLIGYVKKVFDQSGDSMFPDEYKLFFLKFLEGVRGTMTENDIEELSQITQFDYKIVDKLAYMMLIGSLYSALDIEKLLNNDLAEYFLFINDLVQMRFDKATSRSVISNNQYSAAVSEFFDIALDIKEKTLAYNGNKEHYQQNFRLKWILTNSFELIKFKKQYQKRKIESAFGLLN